jgi:hypothetical protein
LCKNYFEKSRIQTSFLAARHILYLAISGSTWSMDVDGAVGPCLLEYQLVEGGALSNRASKLNGQIGALH